MPPAAPVESAAAPPPPPGRRFGAWALAGGLYAALVVGVAWPWVADPDGRVLGSFQGADMVGTAWTWWWTAQALVSGQSPASCTLTWFPHGLWPLAQFNLVDGVFTAPFLLLLGPAAGYSLGAMAMLWTNGLAVRWLARAAGAGAAAATAVGAVATLHPFCVWELGAGRPSQAWIALPALALGAWHRVAEGQGGWRAPALAAVLSALSFLEYWYAGMFVALGAMALALPQLPRLRTPEGRARLLRAMVGLVLTLALVAPFVALLLDAAATLPGLEASDPKRELVAASRGEVGLDWAILASRWALWPVYGDGGQIDGPPEPWALLALALLPLVAWRRGRLGFLAVAATGYLLALGPFVEDAQGGIVAEIPLPYLWLYETVPYFSRFWWPYRAGVLLALGLLVVAARNLDDLRAEAGRIGAALPAVLVAATVLQLAVFDRYYPLVGTPTLEAGPVYDRVTGPIIGVPLFGTNDQSRLHLWFQAAHGQPMIYGLGAHLDGHRPAAIDALVAGNPFLQGLAQLDQKEAPATTVTPADLAALRALGFEQVVLERRAFPPDWHGEGAEMAEPWLVGLLGQAVEDDGVTAVWTLPPP